MPDPRYAPIRYLAERPFGAAIRRLADGHTVQATRYILDHDEDIESLQPQALCYSLALTAFTGADREDTCLGQSFMSECCLAAAAYEFSAAGRHIVCFDKTLTTEFQHTDVDGMTFNDVELPWDAFYLTFEGEDSPSQNSPIEGCMIFRFPEESNEINLVPFMKEIAPVGTIQPNPSLLIPIKIDENQDMKAALLEGLDHVIEGLHDDIPKGAEELVSVVTQHYRSNTAAITQLLNLVGNSLLYLTGEPPADQIWQADAPADLVARAKGANGAARKAGQALIKQGYTKIHFTSLPAGETGSNLLGGTVRPHWRRGHWRRQRHGPGLQQTKIIRIRPTVVAGNRSDANATGRIHIAA